MSVSSAIPFDVTKAWVQSKFQWQRQITAARFSPCGRFVFAAGINGAIIRWDLETEQQILFESHDTWVGDFAFDSESKRMYSGDYHGTLTCWDYSLDQPKQIWQKIGSHNGWIRKVTVSPDGSRIATGGNDLSVRIWNAKGKSTDQLEGHQGYIFSLIFHPETGDIFSGDQLGMVRQWNKKGNLIREFDLSVLHTRLDNFLAHVGGVRCMAIDTTRNLLACGGFTNAKSNSFCPGDPLISIVDLDSANEVIQLKPTIKADGPINGMRFLSDGTLVGVGEGQAGASLSFWDIEKPEPIHAIKMLSGYEVDVHPDGMRLAVSRYETNGRTGNGRHVMPEEYVSNDGLVEVYQLSEKPMEDADS